MVRLIFWSALVLMVVIFSSVGFGKSASPEVFYYSWSGGLSNYSSTDVIIRTDGSVLVTLTTYDDGKRITKFNLNKNELKMLRNAITSTDFFSLSKSDSGMCAIDAGKTTIRVNLNGKSRELSYICSPKMRPLEEFARKLITQAEVIHELETDGNVGEARSAVSPTSAGIKALQPRVLKKPLEDYIHSAVNSSKLSMAVEALAFVVTPKEFAGFLSSELDRADISHRVLLLNVITIFPFVDNIGKENYEALKPVLAKVLKEDYSRYDSLSKNHRRALDHIIAPILWVRAVPILVESNPARYKEHEYLELPVIKNKGEGLRSIFPLLRNKKAEVRACTAWLFGEIFTWPPEYIERCEDATLTDKDAVAEYIRTTVKPVLITLSQKDPSERVSKAARLSVKQIDKGWAEK